MLMNHRYLVAAACAGVALAIAGQSAMATTELSLSDVLPEGNFQVQNAIEFADRVKDATGGNVVINVHAGGALGFKGPEQLRAVRDGLVPMADVLTSQQIGDEPLFGGETIPFLVSSYSDLKELHKFLRPEYEKLAEKYNQKILYMVPSPPQYLFLKTKVDTVDALRGVKVRGADKTTVDIVDSIGMAGVVIPWGELIPALASGRVEGVATSATSAVDGKFWEFLKYIYPTNHTWSSNMVTVNLDTWNDLSPDERQAIESVAAELEPKFWAVSEAADKAALETLTGNGMEVVPVPPAMMDDIRSGAAPLMGEYLERAPAVEPLVQQYLAAVGRG